MFHGQVVDAETNTPIEGAVIAVIWTYTPFGLYMEAPKYFYQATEAITDAEGRFSMPDSPAEDNPLKVVNRPWFAVFSAGYGPSTPAKTKTFRSPTATTWTDALTALRAGAIIALPRLKTPAEQRRVADLPPLGIDAPVSSIPQTIRALNRCRQSVGLQPYSQAATPGKSP